MFAIIPTGPFSCHLGRDWTTFELQPGRILVLNVRRSVGAVDSTAVRGLIEQAAAPPPPKPLLWHGTYRCNGALPATATVNS